jgi:hypothetical protein
LISHNSPLGFYIYWEDGMLYAKDKNGKVRSHDEYIEFLENKLVQIQQATNNYYYTRESISLENYLLGKIGNRFLPASKIQLELENLRLSTDDNAFWDELTSGRL